MKKSYLTVVLTLTCLFGLGEARAQDLSTVAVNVPFKFVAGGITLPPGAYRVSRLDGVAGRALVIHSYDDSTFLLATIFDGTPTGDTKVRFEHVGDKNFLSKVETPLGVYTIKTPRAMTKLAQIKDHPTGSLSSGTN
jgi:hypothetical protein